MTEGRYKRKAFDFKVAEIGVLKDAWILDVEFFDVEVVLAFEHEVFVEFVQISPAEAVLEIVDQHDLYSSKVEPVKLICRDLQILIIFLLDTLKLV